MAKDNEFIETLVKATDKVEELEKDIDKFASIKNGLSYCAGLTTTGTIALCYDKNWDEAIYTAIATAVLSAAAWVCGRKVKTDVKCMTDLGKSSYIGSLEEQVNNYQGGK